LKTVLFAASLGDVDAEDLEYASRGLSRRGLLLGTAGAAALIAFAGAAPASATVAWNHPFTTRGAIFPAGAYLATNNPYTSNGPHQGIDFNNAIHPGGTAIYSCAAGVVSARETAHASYGNMVRIAHADGYETLYGHMRANSIPADLLVGSPLPAASAVGTVGGTKGSAKVYAEHLHLGLFKNGVRQDPTFLASAPLASPGATTTLEPTTNMGDPMTDVIYYAYTGTSTGAAATTQGLRSPVTSVAYLSIWYQECMGAPLFKIADHWDTIEWRAFAATRPGNLEGQRFATSAAQIAALIDLRGEASSPIASLAPLRV
jgi:murein DD-endopeptidase MepM/ murein hydrolase activator NlpD